MPPISKDSSAGGPKGGRKARLDSTPGHERCQLPDITKRSNSSTRFSEKSLIRIWDGVIGLARRSGVLGFTCADCLFQRGRGGRRASLLSRRHIRPRQGTGKTGIASLRLEQLKPIRPSYRDSVGGQVPRRAAAPGAVIQNLIIRLIFKGFPSREGTPRIMNRKRLVPAIRASVRFQKYGTGEKYCRCPRAMTPTSNSVRHWFSLIRVWATAFSSSEAFGLRRMSCAF